MVGAKKTFEHDGEEADGIDGGEGFKSFASVRDDAGVGGEREFGEAGEEVGRYLWQIDRQDQQMPRSNTRYHSLKCAEWADIARDVFHDGKTGTGVGAVATTGDQDFGRPSGVQGGQLKPPERLSGDGDCGFIPAHTGRSSAGKEDGAKFGQRFLHLPLPLRSSRFVRKKIKRKRKNKYLMTTAAKLRIKHLFVSPGHNYFGHHGQEPSEHPMLECAEIQCRANRGIEGDRFFNYKSGYKGQVTFFSHEVYEELCRKFGVHDKSPSVFRRNIITEGMDLNNLIGQEFEVQGVRFLGTQESAPCHWMNTAFAPGAEDALQGSGGLRAKILADGVLRVSAEDTR